MVTPETGRPPTIPVTLDTNVFNFVFVTSKEHASVIVGLQFVLDEWIILAWRLGENFNIGTTSVRGVVDKCNKILGHISNDDKQINILTGRGSCLVGYPMQCYWVSKNNLGDAPEWLQLKFLCAMIEAASMVAETEQNGGIAPLVTSTFDLHNGVVELVLSMASLPVITTTPRREGETCFALTHALWRRLTRDGRYRMTQADHNGENL